MADETARVEVAAALGRISQAWREGQPADLVPLFHPGMTTAFPGFAGRGEGRDANVAGFEDFCARAAVHEYSEAGHQIDVVGDVAVATFTFEMVYERGGQRSRASGRDLWVFTRQGGRWLAVWRTMLDLAEQPA
jgi:ketosteroid isomerase-like protein